MFLFVENWDIGHDDFKEILAAAQSIKIEKFTNATEWPLFKRWFAKRLANYVDPDKFTLDEFMRAILLIVLPVALLVSLKHSFELHSPMTSYVVTMKKRSRQVLQD